MLRFIREKAHTPRLRFNVGKEPFRRKRLDEIASKKISYGIVQAGDHVPDGMPYIKSQDLNGLLALDRLECTSAEIAKKYRRSEVGPGDIVFSLRGNIGVAQIVPESIPVSNLTQGTARIAVTEDYNKYICCTLQSSDVARQVQAYAKGSTFREISLEDLRKVTIAVPTLPEQQKIADFLTAVDGRIEQLIQKKALLEDYKKGVMQQLLTQAIRFKDDDGNDFPDWEEKKLGELGKITTGKTPSTSDADAWIGETMFVTPSDIGEDTKFQNSTSRHVNGGKLRLIPEHSLMFTCIASVGKMSIATEPCITNQQINSLSVSSDFHFEYVYYALRYLTPRIKATQANTTLPIINKTEFSKFVLPIPSSDEQTKIADFLSAIDRKIESVATQIIETQTFKRGLLQQMFV